MRKYLAEMLGTFILVLVGCGTAIFAGEQVGQLGIAMAFGLALIVAIYAIGHISGGHVNPAVSTGFLIAGKLSAKDYFGYVVFQLLGAVIAAYVLMMIAGGKMSGYDFAVLGLGQNGWGEGYLGEFNMTSAIIFEFIATFLFVRVILTVTRTENNYAGLVIGLTLMVLIIFGLQITGVSLNPARSFGPALLLGGHALEQLWVFILIPALAGLLAGVCFRWCPFCNGACDGKKK